ncbi:MAG: hypothetical protein WCS37_16695 [Chloroflexota bacterium]|nr:hypothetical protein [Chloroflexota bacterium]
MSSEKNRTKRKKLPIIRASEIGTYLYCRRAWWLRRMGGFQPEDPGGRFAQGIAGHARHGRQLRLAQFQRRMALLLSGMALFLFIIALLFFRFW